MATLLETYEKRIKVAESVYSKAHNGEAMSNSKKLAVATLLNNTNRFLTEAFENSVGTQRSDLGQFKKFCLNLTNVAIPNTIAENLVIVHPMTSITGYIAYIRYTIGSSKKADKFPLGREVINDPFRLGDVDSGYTSEAVVEHVESGEVTLAWTPFVKNAFGEGKDVKFIPETGEATYLTISEDGKVTAPAKGKIAYKYDNVVIPQKDIPTVNAKMENIPLLAKARRVAVYYSQIAAFQAKTDYGFDLGDQLAEKACGQLAYEIDTEIVEFLDELAGNALVHFNKRLPVGVSKSEHYEGFCEVIEDARAKVYERTKRFAPNYMIIAADVLPILTFIKGFSAAPAGNINGPYLAGSLNGVKVFVSPAMKEHRFVLGVNGDDMMSSAAVYAPYMAIVPTQLLGYADGSMSQGFSTMYDLKALNPELVIAGDITEEAVEGATAVIRG